jgi:hypothetical protein
LPVTRRRCDASTPSRRYRSIQFRSVGGRTNNVLSTTRRKPGILMDAAESQRTRLAGMAVAHGHVLGISVAQFETGRRRDSTF